MNNDLDITKARFQEDFLFELTKSEYENFKSENATTRRGGRKTPTYVFTGHGLLMLSNALENKKAKKVNPRITNSGFLRLLLQTKTNE